jgi:hypothetical protein
MINKFIFFHLWIIIILCANIAWGADKISGNACYTYGDNESLIQAEQMAKTLAIRNAIESYSTFIESTTKVKDLQITSDLINTVSIGQVKKVKVLKRLESGRKLCYTMVGFVEPKELKAEINEYLSGKKNISEVILQENGWIKIADHFVAELTPEEFYGVGTDDPMVKIRKEMVVQGMMDEVIFKKLHLKIEFLKSCVATTRKDSKKPLSKIEEDIAMGLLIATGAINTGHEKEGKKIIDELLRKYPNDYEEILTDLTVPVFRCNYRDKVFVSFYSAKGDEIETVGDYPIAYWIDSNRTKRKTEMLPGETTYVTFLIPDSAKSWKIWVPK